MSYSDGMAAIDLEMPSRVPRTEYSAHTHWKLINAVTGTDISPKSSDKEKRAAGNSFIKAWNYDFMWSTLISSNVFGDLRTKMGHAEYEQDGVDYSSDIVCPFSDPEEVLDFDFWEAYGRRDHAKMVEDFEAHHRSNMENYPECVNMTGIYVTCISGLIDIFGWDMMLMAAGMDPVRFGDMTNRYASWIQQYFEALADAAVPVVMIHDDIVWTSGAIFHPDWYRKYVFPNYLNYFKPLIESKKKIMFTSDGTYTEFIDDIAATGVNGFVLEPTTDMAYIAERYGKTHSFIGNADTRILLTGTREQIHAEVKRCMDIGKGCPGFFMAVGNHIPSNTPVENAIYYNEVYEKMSKR